jgi:hypothetical protein
MGGNFASPTACRISSPDHFQFGIQQAGNYPMQYGNRGMIVFYLLIRCVVGSAF